MPSRLLFTSLRSSDGTRRNGRGDPSAAASALTNARATACYARPFDDVSARTDSPGDPMVLRPSSSPRHKAGADHRQDNGESSFLAPPPAPHPPEDGRPGHVPRLQDVTQLAVWPVPRRRAPRPPTRESQQRQRLRERHCGRDLWDETSERPPDTEHDALISFQIQGPNLHVSGPQGHGIVDLKRPTDSDGSSSQSPARCSAQDITASPAPSVELDVMRQSSLEITHDAG